MSKITTEKAVAYVTQGNKLLVFSHPLQPEAGIQVPAGTIKEGESPEDAVLRETREETGLELLEIRAFLGVQEFDLAPYAKAELQRRHFFHLEFQGQTPRTWRHREAEPSDGSPGPIEFEFFWAELPDQVPFLIAGQGALLWKLTGSEPNETFGISQPIITPAKWLGRDSVPQELEGCSQGLVAFCPSHSMLDKLEAVPVSESLFSHVDRSHQFVGHVAGEKVLAVECVYGGPLAATVIEELAHFGIRKIIGYGYGGSLTREIPVGAIVLAASSSCSGGAAHEYLPGERVWYPDPTLAQALAARAAASGVAVHRAKIWTTDALYREYPERIAAWRHEGAQVVNMDTSHFYAVSKVVGTTAVYACVVSDSVEGPVWEDGFARIRQSVNDLEDLIVATLDPSAGRGISE